MCRESSEAIGNGVNRSVDARGKDRKHERERFALRQDAGRSRVTQNRVGEAARASAALLQERHEPADQRPDGRPDALGIGSCDLTHCLEDHIRPTCP